MLILLGLDRPFLQLEDGICLYGARKLAFARFWYRYVFDEAEHTLRIAIPSEAKRTKKKALRVLLLDVLHATRVGDEKSRCHKCLHESYLLCTRVAHVR